MIKSENSDWRVGSSIFICMPTWLTRTQSSPLYTAFPKATNIRQNHLSGRGSVTEPLSMYVDVSWMIYPPALKMQKVCLIVWVMVRTQKRFRLMWLGLPIQERHKSSECIPVTTASPCSELQLYAGWIPLVTPADYNGDSIHTLCGWLWENGRKLLYMFPITTHVTHR